MNYEKTVYLIILNCNNMDVIPALCDSLINSTDFNNKFDRGFNNKFNDRKVYVEFIDQGSTDGSKEYLIEFCEKYSPFCRLTKLKQNIGTTKAWNIGIKNTDLYYLFQDDDPSRYICLINSDMKVSRNFLSPMIKIMEDNPKCGMVSNTLRDYTDITFIQNYGPNLHEPWHYIMLREGGMMYLPQEMKQSRKVEWGHMGCTLFKSEVFDNIGLFDENMFIYSSDFDIQFRLKLAGYEVWFCPESYAQHKTFVTCNELKKNPVIEEICKKDGEYLHWKWGDKVIEWFNKSKEAYDINKNLKAIYGEDFNSNEIHA